MMAGEMLMKQATPVQPSGPGGFAILCFIVGAPHIYGVIQSHQQFCQGGFACAAFAGKAQGLPARQGKTNVQQSRKTALRAGMVIPLAHLLQCQ